MYWLLARGSFCLGGQDVPVYEIGEVEELAPLRELVLLDADILR